MDVQCLTKSEPTKIIDGERVEWSDLPTELWSIIGDSLNKCIDVLRFRSVCLSWRSSIPPFYALSPFFPLKFPQTYVPASTEPRSPGPVQLVLIFLRALPWGDDRFPLWQERSYEPADLCQRTFYTLQRLNPTASTSNPAYAAADHKSWLIEVDESNPGKFRLLDPYKSHPLYYSLSQHPIGYPVNLLNTRLVELATGYRARYSFATGIPKSEDERIYIVRGSSIHGVQKVVMVPNSAKNDADQLRSVFVVFDDGNLGYANLGDEDLTLVGGGRNVECHDIVVYKGKMYFVDNGGVVWRIKLYSSSWELVQFSDPLFGFGSRMKRLVESRGALYLLDGFIHMNSIRGFRVYELHEGSGRWVRVKNLDDQAFIFCSDCSFSISAPEVAGFRSNCIYYIHDNEIHVFSFKVHG
ncbi:hypothetical protein CJ030_MR2G004735 [Morella rubra]|uniref:KIB1-4 beta-propeller domain-containing protein n=1 Tax=Morella rubra TaxID=262757 RepID=A0A6A1WEM4_9ROSI|nr:hypothetical protein CJ030_MR2G004735 [Morella rubra]